MKATLDAAQFSQALSRAVKATGHTRYIDLEQVRVDVGSGLCRLTAANLDQFLTAEIPAQGETFSFKLCNTQAVLKASKYFDGPLSLDYDSGELLLTCEPRSSRLVVDTVEHFPELPPAETPLAVYHTNAQTLYKRFEHVKYAMADQNSTRPAAYKGVRFMDTRLAALDGYRLALHKDASLNVEKPFILPEGAMKLLQLFGGADIRIEVGKKWCVIHADGLCLVTHLVEYDKLNIDDAIPTSFRDEYTADVQQFADGLNYLRALVPEKARRPITFEDGTLKVSTCDGEHRSSIQISGPTSVVFGFNGKYMLESLNQFKDAQTVTIKVNKSPCPIVLTNNGSDFALVFPVNLRREEAA